MYRRSFLAVIALTIIVVQFIRRRFLSFESLMKKNKENKKYISKRDSLRLVKMIKKIAHFFRISSCFTKTLCFRYALKLSDFQTKIYVGVKEENNTIKSHCWVVADEFHIEDHQENSSFKIIKVYK